MSALIDNRLTDERIDFFNEFVRRVKGVPVNWQWKSLDGIGASRQDGGFLMKGGIPPLIKSGKRAGEPNWSKATDQRSFLVTFRELDEFVARWEIETGRCSKCQGSGEEVCGWSRDHGAQHRCCSKCSGSGRPKVLVQSEAGR